MTAHCRREPYDDFDTMADIAMAITARKGQGTEVRREIAEEFRQFCAGKWEDFEPAAERHVTQRKPLPSQLPPVKGREGH